MAAIENLPSAIPACSFGPTVVRAPERAIALEWLETNGLGDYACGTVAGPNTRRQHGLFTCGALHGGGRMLLLAALDVALERDDERSELSCHQYVDARHPQGFLLCSGFDKDPFPEWRYQVPGAALSMRLFTPHGRRLMACVWHLDKASSPGPWRLKVRPLFAYRDADALTQANDAVNMSLRSEDGGFSITPYPGCPEFFVVHGGAKVEERAVWYYRFLHSWDIRLGRKTEEDLFSPCEITFQMGPGATAALLAGVERANEEASALEARERERRQNLCPSVVTDDPAARVLAQAADAFVVRDSNGVPRIITGYPESSENSRSALIAAPGLLLCTGRLEEAKKFVTAELRLAQEGGSAYGLGDQALWLIRAGEQYVSYSHDWGFLRETLAPACEALIQRYVENQSNVGFRLAPDGLLTSAASRAAHTWMDAGSADRPATPRRGKPVEVNALWHHALMLANRWAHRGSRAEAAHRFDRLRELCGRSFRHRFWNASEACLYDVVDPEPDFGADADPAIRPNQLFAVSLPSDLLDRRQATSVLSMVENRLLTPYGLRTLSLEDPAFRPRCTGGPDERAAARHQGSIFPWLIGAHVDAIFRVHGRTSRAYARAEACLEPLLNTHLRDDCVGQVSELFDGTVPYSTGGAFAHAPAVAELLRVCCEVKGKMW